MDVLALNEFLHVIGATIHPSFFVSELKFVAIRRAFGLTNHGGFSPRVLAAPLATVVGENLV
eukprot:166790-Amorphochlora_amoeboformis.AAC.1